MVRIKTVIVWGDLLMLVGVVLDLYKYFINGRWGKMKVNLAKQLFRALVRNNTQAFVKANQKALMMAQVNKLTCFNSVVSNIQLKQHQFISKRAFSFCTENKGPLKA